MHEPTLFQEMLPELLSWLTLAVGCSVLAFVLRFSLVRRGECLFPAPRTRAVPWGSPEIYVVVFVVYVLWPGVVYAVLDRINFFTWMYGPEFRTAVKDSHSVAAGRLELLVGVFAWPLQLVTVPAVCRLWSGARLYQLGLTLHRGTANVLLGVLAWLITTPGVLGLGLIASLAYKYLTKADPVEHPITILAGSGPSAAEWVAIVTLPLIAAPIIEELLFRGFLQRWFASRSWGGLVAMGAALVLAALYGRGSMPKGDPNAVGPVVFVAAAILAYPLFVWGVWRWIPSTQASGAVYGTALLFAAMHSPVWPSPVPLFGLGLVLGYLAYRTQSLVAPVVLHGLFNGIACLSFLYPPPPVPVPVNGKDATSALQRNPPDSTSSAVPGSWLPRRTYASATGAPSRGDTADEVTAPTSLPSRRTRAPRGTAPPAESLNPTSDRLTWP
jgi:membrane protease YdiL (CAAX protease family)